MTLDCCCLPESICCKRPAPPEKIDEIELLIKSEPDTEILTKGKVSVNREGVNTNEFEQSINGLNATFDVDEAEKQQAGRNHTVSIVSYSEATGKVTEILCIVDPSQSSSAAVYAFASHCAPTFLDSEKQRILKDFNNRQKASKVSGVISASQARSFEAKKGFIARWLTKLSKCSQCYKSIMDPIVRLQKKCIKTCGCFDKTSDCPNPVYPCPEPQWLKNLKKKFNGK